MANKRGLSPVVATVLLILIGVTLAVIIFLWARSFIAEKAQKTVGDQPEAIEQFCDDLSFDADVIENSGSLEVSIVNRGNIPIYGIELRQKTAFSTKMIGVGDGKLNLGEGALSGEDGSATFTTSEVYLGKTLIVAPVLLGTIGDSDDQRTYTCDNQYGVEAVVS